MSASQTGQAMQLGGHNLIGGERSAEGSEVFYASDPARGEQLPTAFHAATSREVERAFEAAARAAPLLRDAPVETIARALDQVAEHILALGAALIDVAAQETALPRARLESERTRTVNQARLFGGLVREGSFLDARIDPALPDRQPLPRPDLRRMLRPIGPVVVFGASNFPLAFSVAGGDTVSALAGRNPVVYKAHPAHPGTSELVAGAVARAIEEVGLPAGAFSLLQGTEPALSLMLAQHPVAQAVSFTGSERAGRAIFDAAARRPAPIPVYAEMGSVNPVFVLPRALAERAQALAEEIFQSVTLGVGQFCTCPGLVFAAGGTGFAELESSLTTRFAAAPSGIMLHEKVRAGYQAGLERLQAIAGVHSTLATVPGAEQHDSLAAPAALFQTDVATWLARRDLAKEVFGPSSVLVCCQSTDELVRVARALEGSLTATVHGTAEDLEENRALLTALEEKAGRLIINGYPTGVEVSPAMHHGGPYPATTDVKFTSVGTAAILRFLRPICFQGFPDALLPPELQNANPRGIWRTINGTLTREGIHVDR